MLQTTLVVHAELVAYPAELVAFAVPEVAPAQNLYWTLIKIPEEKWTHRL